MPTRKGLSEKQKRFVAELIKDWDRTKAAKRAGYSPKTAYNIAYQLMRKEDVLKRVEEELQKQQDRTRLDADYVLYGVKEIADWCVMPDYWNPQSALKAYELIGKHFKMFVDTKEVTGKNGGPIEHEHTVGLSPDAEKLIKDLESDKDDQD